MSVENVKNNYGAYSPELNKTAAAQSKTDDPSKAAEQKTASGETDAVELSSSYKMDINKVLEMKSSLFNKVDAFEKMVNALFQKQGITYDQSVGMKKNLENLIASGGVSEADRLQAEQAVSEDGDLGVEKTAQRILDFAKALSGGDPEKIETMKNAVIKGFKEAERVWGGKLPEISYKTYDRIMEGFDEWAAQANQKAADNEGTE